jgi:excisionase family DNA binding protein
MLAIGVASRLLGVCKTTLRRWDAQGKVSCVQTAGGHRRFSLEEISRLKGKKRKPVPKTPPKPLRKSAAIYSRVSSHKQKKRGDLRRQVAVLKTYCANRSLTVAKIYTDVGSGLSTTRRGLWRLIEDAKKGLFSRVVINYKDRLTRFGYRYVEKYLNEYGVQLCIVHSLEGKSLESELVEDMIAIVHSFSGKMYRLRRDKIKKTIHDTQSSS